jgi:hypothetical protein
VSEETEQKRGKKYASVNGQSLFGLNTAAKTAAAGCGSQAHSTLVAASLAPIHLFANTKSLLSLRHPNGRCHGQKNTKLDCSIYRRKERKKCESSASLGRVRVVRRRVRIEGRRYAKKKEACKCMWISIRGRICVVCGKKMWELG